MAPALRLLATTALVALAACAHAPAQAPPRAEVVWPEPPGAPRARLAALVPDPAAPPPRRAWWRVALGWLTGADADERPEQLLPRPFAVVIEADGAVVAADPDAGRVLRFSPGRAPEDLTCPGATWQAPIALALGAGGEIFVADAAAGTVVRWAGGACRVLGKGQLERPTGLAVSRDRLWVADPPRHQVIAFSASGEVLVRVGERGDGDGRFNFPSSVAAATDGGILVVDALNFRVVRLAPDGRWLGSFGEQGSEGGAFALPKAIATDAAGRVYVSDAQRDLVLAFSPDGSFEFAIGASGSEAGWFVHPAGVAVSGRHIAVADSHNHRVQVFELIGERS